MKERNEEELLKLIFENLGVGIFLLDANSKTVLCNEETVKMYRCSRNEYEKHYSDGHAARESGIVRHCISDLVVEQKREVSGWNQIVGADGTSQLYYYQNKPIFDENGQVKYVLGMAQTREQIESSFHDSVSSLENFNRTYLVPELKPKVIYESKQMKEIVQHLQRVSNTNANVLLFGETGVGKDVMANFIHDHSAYRDNTMVTVNCAAIPPNLFEAEFFGYEKGSFTGANKMHIGLIESANNSTLFLDEIDSMPLEQQGKLLQVLETKSIRRIGSNQPIQTNFRLIAATNKNLMQMVNEGKFRIDLYYRLNIVSATIPPLRQRKEDIRPLVKHFLEQICTSYGLQKEFSEKVYQQMENYDWPGNIRELRNTVERTVICSERSAKVLNYVYLATDNNIEPESNDTESQESKEVSVRYDFGEQKGASLKEQMSDYEKQIIEEALKTYGSPTKAAAALGVSLSSISRKMSQYHIEK